LTSPHRDAAISAIADAQHGQISLPQLLSVGLTASGVRDRVAAGKLHRLYRGAYSVGHSRVTWMGRYMGAVLACGEGAVASHRVASRLHGMRQSAGRMDVTVPGRRVRIPGIDAHQTRALRPEDVTIVERIPCTSVARTLVDEAETESDRGLERLIGRAEELRIFHLGDLERAMAQASGRRGARRLTNVVGLEPAMTRNDLEERFYEICARAGLRRPQVNLAIVLGDGGPHVEADFAWPELRLIVETDGWATHGTRRAFVHDRRRDRRLALAGWRVLRFTWEEIEHRPDLVAAELGALLAAAS
jgi:hypothetical protein